MKFKIQVTNGWSKYWINIESSAKLDRIGLYDFISMKMKHENGTRSSFDGVISFTGKIRMVLV